MGRHGGGGPAGIFWDVNGIYIRIFLWTKIGNTLWKDFKNITKIWDFDADGDFVGIYWGCNRDIKI